MSTFWHTPLTVPDFFRQCTFSLHDTTRQLVIQDWSLGVELKGSLMIPVFLFCARPKYVALNFGLAALLLVFGVAGKYYVPFIVGVLIAQYGNGWGEQLARLGRRTREGFFVGGLLLYQGINFTGRLFPDSRFADKASWVVTAIGCGVILLSVLGSQTLQQLLNRRPVVFLGRISYSVYLLQLIVILCLLPPLVAALNNWGITQPPILFPAVMLAGAAATIGGAALMYQLVELPVINFGHWLTRKIQLKFQR